MNNSVFSLPIQRLLLPGPAGNLETVIELPKSSAHSTITVVCHPHPLYGGTMENKVVTSLARAFRELEMTTVRFNFRGVGKSSGEYAHAIGESEDLLAILKWLAQTSPDSKIILAGFSFGAYVATRIASEWPIQQLVTVAPPVNHFDFTTLPLPTSPWLIIQGTNDEVVPADEVFAWLKAHAKDYKLIILENASHFFHGRLTELREKVIAYFTSKEANHITP